MSEKKLTIQSSKLGWIEYDEDDTITLVSPLLGFTDLNDYLIISNAEYFPFLWFQSVEDPSVCFILIEPEPFFPDYKPIVNKREFKVLGASELKDLKMFCIVVIPDNPRRSTANLRAPLLVNFDRKLAKQAVLDGENWDIRSPIFPTAE